MTSILHRLFGDRAPRFSYKPVELCQLVGDFEATKHEGPWFASVKIDGMRAIYVEGKVMTREGGPLDAALHCVPALRALEGAFGQSMVLDGEYQARAGYNATMAEFKSGKGEGIFWIFDAIPLAAYIEGRCDTPIEERLALLQQCRAMIDSPFVSAVAHIGAKTRADVARTAAAIWNAGGEGVVAKRVGSPYIRGRSDDWAKLKRELELICPIIDIMTKGGVFTGIMVRGPSGPLKITSGMSGGQKRAFAAMALAGVALDNARCKIRFNEIAGTNTPRHASFVEVTE